jgi:hypothetical protein
MLQTERLPREALQWPHRKDGDMAERSLTSIAALLLILALVLGATNEVAVANAILQPGGQVSNVRMVTLGDTPGLAITPSGDFLLAYNQISNTSIKCLRTSSDGGNTWGAENQMWNASVAGDPTLWVTPGNNLLVEFGKNNAQSVEGAAWSLSEDSGVTWSLFSWFDNPVSNTEFVPTYLNVGSDVYGMGYGPYYLNDGTTDVGWWKSENDGVSFSKVSTVRQPRDASINESAAIQTGATSIFLIARSASNMSTYVHTSNDLGLTWSSQIDYTSQIGVIQNPNLQRVGKVIVLHGRDYLAKTFVAYFSYDNGVTFGSKLVLDTPIWGPDAISYSASVVLPGQNLLIAYETNIGNGAQINLLNLYVEQRRIRGHP